MSLRLRAVLVAGISLMVLWTAAAAWMMRGVHANLDRTLDERLAMSARMVSGLLERAALAPNMSPGDFAEVVRANGTQSIACEIRSLRGEVLARTTSAPHAQFATLAAGFSTRQVQGNAWRIYVLQANGYQITSGDRRVLRAVLSADLLRAAGIPFVIAILGGLGALWVGIGRGLAPLQALSQQLQNKDADDISRIGVHRPPAELRPVLDALNGLLERLSRTLSSQRAFTDAAAHELRTPLTVIDTHLQVVRLTDGEEAEESLSSAEEGVRRLRRTLDQMMVLARTETPAEKGDCCTSVLQAVSAVCSQARVNVPLRLSLQVAGDDAATCIPKSMLEAAVRNLVDNAMRYSPAPSLVEVSVKVEHALHRCNITIADRGPGLSVAQTAQAGRRFWRADQGRAGQDGSGLGISIVRAIAERFGGTLDLKPRLGGGLVAELQFPLVQTLR